MNRKYYLYIKDLCTYLMVIFGVFLFKEYLFAPVIVNGDSMDNTLLENDIMILDKVSKNDRNIHRFDIVVIKYQDRYLIKRVIALPGELLYVEDNVLYVNGEEVKQPFLDKKIKTEDFTLQFRVPDKCYFVMGDNRGVSLDSRSLGCFSIDKIEGKANLTILPINRIGMKK